MRISTAALCLAACLAASGCAPQVTYQDPEAVETVTADFGHTDLQTIANNLSSSLLQCRAVGALDRPALYFHGIRNKTDEHIDTEMITDRMKVALVQSGKVRYIGAMEVAAEIRNQIEYQTGSGMVRPDTAVRVGRQIGARFFLYGNFSNIRKRAGRTMDVFYQLTLNMIDIETGVLEWSDKVDISKAERRALFGR